MVTEMLTFFTLIFWSLARVKLLDYLKADVQAIAFFLHLFVLASCNGWVQSLGGLYHSRSKQRTDQRILVCVITLKFFALGKPVFPRKKILPKKCLTCLMFYLYTLQLFSRPIEYFQKNIKLIFVHENIKNGPQKLLIIASNYFFHSTARLPKPPGDFLEYFCTLQKRE